ncbi:hypothetical protein ACO0K9_27215 [Undibacterium sp. Ji50W]|uniref:hypothetical protein n=1 Tax=Undibacterium sp. Ji50W TaxID=3413041 RepID=UPI003BEF8CBC
MQGFDQPLPTQIEEILVTQGYKAGNRSEHLLGPDFRGHLAYIMYSKAATGFEKAGEITVGFGPQSGTAVAIARRENFYRNVSASELKKALAEKYGVPTIEASGEMRWISYRSGVNPKSASLESCKARDNMQVNYGQDVRQFKDCKQSLYVSLSESPNNGLEYRKIEVGMIDFSVYSSEWTAMNAMIAKKNAEGLEKNKAIPLPRL